MRKKIIGTIVGIGIVSSTILGGIAYAEKSNEQVNISVQSAKTIAIKAHPGAAVKDIELDKEDGNYFYTIDLVDLDNKYEVTVNPVNGKVIIDKAEKIKYRSSVTVEEDKELTEQEETKVLLSLAKISLNEAVTNAVKAIPRGQAVKAELEEEDGQVIYNIDISSMEGIREVIVDPVTGKILYSELSEQEGVIPDSLATLEGTAEDIIDVVPQHKWNTVNEDVTAIEQSWDSYLSQNTNEISTDLQVKMTAAIVDLKKYVTQKNDQGIMQAANNVSAVVIELFDRYQPALPVDIGRLDVLERQVILDVAARDFSAVSKSLEKAKTIWSNLKPAILEHNGAMAAEKFDTSFSIQTAALKAKNTGKLTAEAKNGLELVDALEELYINDENQTEHGENQQENEDND